MRPIALMCFLVITVFLLFPITAKAQTEPIVITEQTTFVDSQGQENVVGTVKNVDMMPSEVYLGVKVTDGNSSRLLENLTYGRVVWPLTESPFKITLPIGDHTQGGAYVGKVRSANVPRFDTFLLNYSNMGVGTNKALVGTVKNISPFDMRDVSVFASVHDSTGKQIDTVRSNPIPVLHAGEMLSFEARPDPSLKEKVLYYSCAGLDADAPISTVDVGGGRFIAFQIEAWGEIAGFHYDNSTGSIKLIFKPYGPKGAPFTIKLPENLQNQEITISVDGQLDQNAMVKTDGKTVTVNLFVPEGDHNVSIQGIQTVPELSNVPIMLAASLFIVIVFTIALKNSRIGAGFDTNTSY